MSKKFNLDKYYTPDSVVNYVTTKAKEIVGDTFDYVIEPSAGGGAFIKAIESTFKNGEKVYLDLQPTSDGIVQQDYLEYVPQEGRCLVIGNPPFGTRNTLSVRFFKKSLYAEYIVFVLPVSQLNNNQQMFEFDLIHSEDLGKVLFYNEHGDIRDVPCCLNIYKKPIGGFNKKKKYKFKEVSIFDYRKSLHFNKDLRHPNIATCAWGSGVGKECEPKTYSQELHIFSDNPDIVNFIRVFDWSTVCSKTASPALYRWHIYEELLKNFKITEA